jgi:hypothetical protein
MGVPLGVRYMYLGGTSPRVPESVMFLRSFLAVYVALPLPSNLCSANAILAEVLVTCYSLEGVLMPCYFTFFPPSFSSCP